MTKKPNAIAREIPLHGMSFGLPRMARSLVQQRVEAWLGLCFLIAGFMAQSVLYLTAGSDVTMNGWREYVVAAIALVVPAATAFYLWKAWVPRASRRLWDQTWRTGYDGKPLEGEKLAEAERNFTGRGPWGDLRS